MKKHVSLTTLGSHQTLSFSFIDRKMELTLLILSLIIFKGGYHSVTINSPVQFKSSINGLMDGKFKTLIKSVEFKINLRSSFIR